MSETSHRLTGARSPISGHDVHVGNQRDKGMIARRRPCFALFRTEGQRRAVFYRPSGFTFLLQAPLRCQPGKFCRLCHLSVPAIKDKLQTRILDGPVFESMEELVLVCSCSCRIVRLLLLTQFYTGVDGLSRSI